MYTVTVGLALIGKLDRPHDSGTNKGFPVATSNGNNVAGIYFPEDSMDIPKTVDILLYNIVNSFTLYRQ